MDKAGAGAREIGAWGFCRGPGSVLGIRIASAAFAAMRAANPEAKLFTWDLLEAYAELAGPALGKTFSIVCPSRKNFANALSMRDKTASCGEIPASEIKSLPAPRLLVRQRDVADANFDGMEEVFFGAAEIFRLLKACPRLARILDARETADALTLAKREYVKWNSQAHS